MTPILLAIDVGNSRVTFGLFRGDRLVRKWSEKTELLSAPPAARRALLAALRRSRGGGISGVCIASVVPPLDRVFSAACRCILGMKPLFATARTVGIPLGRYPRRQIGPDRLVNALAARARFKRSCIIIDAGTAITVDGVDGRGHFLGGAIAPGPSLMARALEKGTERLPWVGPVRPRHAIGRSTRGCIRSGVLLGAAGLVDRLVREIAREMGGRPLVIATGGAAPLLAPLCTAIHRVEPDFTLEGLRVLWERKRLH